MRFGSVCSGIEAASVAWSPLGWQAAWFAEIEPFPAAVLAHHYPETPNLGDMTTIARRVLTGEAEAPDVLCGGTPCQAFSIAGLRESLADERGNLTLKFVELADAIDFVRVRDGRPPAVVFWENVPGVLSTKDNAFGCFLAGLAGEDEPLQPPRVRWTNAGAVYGPARAIAWRTLDAQYFGLAQRRRRVFVVASARDGFDPAAVLFEWDGVRRDTPPSREAGEGSADGTLRSTDGGSDVDHALAGHVITMAHGKGGAEIGFDRRPTLTCNHEAPIAAYAVHGTQDPDVSVERAHTLGRNSGQENAVLAFSCKDHGGDAVPISPTLRSMGHDGSHANAGGQVAVTFQERGRDGGRSLEIGGDVAYTLMAPNGGGRAQERNVLTSTMQVRRLTPRECERLQGFQWQCSPDYPGAWQDEDGVWWSPDYTLIPYGRAVRIEKLKRDWIKYLMRGGAMTFEQVGQAAADGPRYKALGNSWAVPCVRWIGMRIKEAA